MDHAVQRSGRLLLLVSLLGASVVGTTGCSRTSSAESEPIRPVKTMVITAGGDTRTRIFPGVAEAARRVELAFQVPGVITELSAQEGQAVAQGDVIARLRPDEFQARLAALEGELDQSRAALRRLQSGERQEETLRRESAVRSAAARLANARAEFGRYQRLIASNATSRSAFELAETNYQVAQQDHEAAVQLLEMGRIGREEDIEAQKAQVRGLEGRVVEAALQLQDTTLTAPYAGVISQRFVEQGQNVQAKQAVVRLQDVEEIEVVVDVPESVMISDIRRADITELWAEFSGAAGLRFPVEIREIEQVADPTTQTFKVRAVMPAPENFSILPGMTATVTAIYRPAEILGQQVTVPISAVFKDDQAGEQIVWVLTDEAGQQRVSRRLVTLGDASGGVIEIASGLAPGERIAIAGVSRLRENMLVRDLGDGLGSR